MAGPLGSAIKRREDPSLVRGKRRYTDDLKVQGMLHAAIVRSPHAHAKVTNVDTSAALAIEGVEAAYTAADVAASGIPGLVPVGWLLPDLKTPPHPILAIDTVRHVGDAVAVVVASDRYTARDAADAVVVDYEPLDAVTNPAAAAADGAVQIHEEAENNIAFDFEIGDAAAVEEAFGRAAHTASLDLRNQRLIPGFAG